MNIATLKEIIKDLPDDMYVLIPSTKSNYDFIPFCEAYVKKVDFEIGEDELIEDLEVLMLNQE